MVNKISKTWNTGLPITVGKWGLKLPSRSTLALIVAPFVIKWGVVLGVNIPIVIDFALQEDTPSFFILFGYIFIGSLISYIIGYGLSFLFRSFMMGELLGKIKKSNDIGFRLWQAASVFETELDLGNSCFVTNPLIKAILKVGIVEMDSILADLKKEDKLSPMLRWRLIAWAEKFGDEINLLFPYDTKPTLRKQSGYWAKAILPVRYVEEWDKGIREPILQALAYADPDEGTRLSAFLAEAGMMQEESMSDHDKMELMVLSERAKEMADNILVAQSSLPAQNRKNNLASIRRILSDDSADTLQISASVERTLLTQQP